MIRGQIIVGIINIRIRSLLVLSEQLLSLFPTLIVTCSPG
ncbi:hypothetical protein SpAn4DRAFT_2766 [Sporomusa ovata]|uniref:Uncharacterized protein n=1 Tax=Sporomusa ovata TaxID=2378 RepID=A0A0U1KY59_9FIRM|nr:hypothetical protein SpAn4DRAFT_2766 [Sporomusa ovata]